MYSLALIGMGLQAIVSLVIGVRLLALGRRTRRFPELALSVETLLSPALGYPALLVAVGLERAGLPGVAPVFFFGLSIMMVAISMNLFFTWRVFRPGRAWAVILCGVGAWLLLAPLGGVVVHIAADGTGPGIQSAGVWAVLVMAGILIAHGWASLESFRYYLKARRQLRLGLMEAPVCNRFLLWAMASGAWFLAAVLAGFLMVSAGANPLAHGLFTLCGGLTNLLNSICMLLCFMPPERYLAWLRQRAVALQGA